MNGETPLQIKDLSKRLIDVYVPKAAVGAEGNQDAWAAVAVEQVDECYSTEMQVLKHEMSKIRVRKTNEETGEEFFEFYGGVARQQDIDFFKFYSSFALSIPNLGIGIRKILGHPTATGSCERSFNVAADILNIRRCGLEPARAESLILSAVRFKNSLRKESRLPPRIPSLGIVCDDDYQEDFDIDEEDYDEDLENSNDDAFAWDSFSIE